MKDVRSVSYEQGRGGKKNVSRCSLGEEAHRASSDLLGTVKAMALQEAIVQCLQALLIPDQTIHDQAEKQLEQLQVEKGRTILLLFFCSNFRLFTRDA